MCDKLPCRNLLPSQTTPQPMQNVVNLILYAIT